MTKNIDYNIDPSKAIIEIGKDNTILLDVRTPGEYADEHISGSINIDHEEVLRDINKIVKRFKDKTIYVICHSGGRSDLVTRALRQKKVIAFNILGGTASWPGKMV